MVTLLHLQSHIVTVTVNLLEELYLCPSARQSNAVFVSKHISSYRQSFVTVWSGRHLLFTRVTQRVSTVFAVATCLDVTRRYCLNG